MTVGNHNPRILGVPGGGLKNASWLKGPAAQATAAVGAKGEERTAAVLAALAAPVDGPTVLHDLMVPSDKYKANMDHVVVNGSTVHIIDAKVWKPGRYWTLAGKTRRGWSRFEPAEKQTMVVAKQCVEAFLAARGIRATVLTPTLVVWPSSNRAPLRLGLLRVPGAEVWHADDFEKRIQKMHGNGGVLGRATRRPADPAIVAALASRLVVKPHGYVDPFSPAQRHTAAAPVMPDPSSPAAQQSPVMPDPLPTAPTHQDWGYSTDPLPSIDESW